MKISHIFSCQREKEIGNKKIQQINSNHSHFSSSRRGNRQEKQILIKLNEKLFFEHTLVSYEWRMILKNSLTLHVVEIQFICCHFDSSKHASFQN